MREREYVTIAFDKRNFGLKGLELTDIFLALLGILIFVIIILAFGQPIVAIYFIIIYLFLLSPIQISNKNRVYKILFMIGIYYLNKHIYIYQKEQKEGVLNESYQRLKKVKNQIRQRIDN